jgi:hypothetical protein
MFMHDLQNMTRVTGELGQGRGRCNGQGRGRWNEQGRRNWNDQGEEDGMNRERKME